MTTQPPSGDDLDLPALELPTSLAWAKGANARDWPDLTLD